MNTDDLKNLNNLEKPNMENESPNFVIITSEDKTVSYKTFNDKPHNVALIDREIITKDINDIMYKTGHDLFSDYMNNNIPSYSLQLKNFHNWRDSNISFLVRIWLDNHFNLLLFQKFLYIDVIVYNNIHVNQEPNQISYKVVSSRYDKS